MCTSLSLEPLSMSPSMTMENEGCKWNYIIDQLTRIIQVDPELSQDPYQWTRVSGEEDTVMPRERTQPTVY